MKRIYFQPEVNVATIAMQSNLLAGSAGGGGKSMNMSIQSHCQNEHLRVTLICIH